jgi:glycosyltransferase involved in cell wall biosynthesis
MLLVSVIIPAYKVEDYIERCIRSLEDQDIPKEAYEIIVVNDGSPDSCRAIVEELQLYFKNIVLINQENMGVSMARNNAMAIARGKYILPIDPDDYVVPNILKDVVEKIERENLDVLYLGFEIFNLKGESTWVTNYSEHIGVCYSGVEGYFAARGKKEIRDPDRSFAILYRTSMLKNISIWYPKNVPYLEDGLFLAKVFAVANKVGFDNTPVYQRTTRIGSATNSELFYSKRAIDGFIFAVMDIKSFASRNNLNEDQRGLVNHTIAKFVFLALSPSVARFNLMNYFSILRVLRKQKIKKLEIVGVRSIYLKLVKVFNFSTVYLLFYMIWIQRVKR